MKKYISILILALFIIPSVALASWWNPFTWKIFKKKEPAPQVQVVNTEKEKTSEDKIKDLQKQLDDLKSKKPEIKKLEPAVSKKNNPKEKQKENIIVCNGQNYEDSCPSLGKKFICFSNLAGCATKEEENNIVSCNGKAFSKCENENDNLICPIKGDAYCETKSTNSTSSSDLNKTLSELNKSFQSNLEASQKIQAEKEAQALVLKNSPECISATDRLSLKNSELKNTESRIAQITTMTQEKGDLLIKLGLLNSEILKITYEKYEACQGYIPGEIPKTYNTSCYYIGYTLHCNTQ